MNGYSRLCRVLSGAGACILVLAPGTPAVAADGASLDEVVVTARKREENLQDVSMSISAISSQQIERLGINSVQDVARINSSLIFDKGYSATDNRLSIRGLSPTRGRVNVAVLVDGIDTSSESIAFGGGSLLATGRLLDLERVEIVKGPQSALYGRSAFGGAIQYVTKDPAKTFESAVRADIGDYGRQEFVASASGPVNDAFGLRFNAVYWNDDGVYRNSITGGKVGGGDGFGASLAAKWEISESFDVKARVEYTSDSYAPGATATLRHNTVSARPTDGTLCYSTTSASAAPVTANTCPAGTARVYSRTLYDGPAGNSVYSFRGEVPDGDTLEVRFDPNPLTGRDYVGSERDVARLTLIANWQVGHGTLTSWTGYTDAEFSFDEDGDFDSAVVNGVETTYPAPFAGGARAARFDYSNQTKQFSEELRFQSDLDGPFNYALGGLYWKEEVDQVQRSVNIFCLPPIPSNTFFPGQPPFPASCQGRSANQLIGLMTAIPRDTGRDIEHKSFYGLAELEFASIWKLTGEVRWSDEKEKVLGVNCSPTLDAALFPGGPITKCQDPTLAGFQVFGPSINYLYPFFNPFAPSAPGPGVRQAPGVPVRLSSSHTFTTPRLTLEVKPNADLLAYLTVARAVKPGGISTVTAGAWQDADYDGAYDEFTFKDEKLTEYEAGIKSTLMGGRLRLNPAIFLQKYQDKQIGAQLVTPSGIAVGRLLNAGKADIKGLELDVELQATENWLFGLNYTYLDAEFTDFPFSSTSSTDAARNGGCPRIGGSVADARVCHFNLKGNQLERAPKSSAVALARYSHPLGALGDGARWYVEGDVQSMSKRYVDFWNQSWLPAYTKANLRLGVQTARWDALVYVNNVTDDRKPTSANSNPGDVDMALSDPYNFSPADTLGVSLPDPRIVGIRVGYRFR